jgi:hypothetical protein
MIYNLEGLTSEGDFHAKKDMLDFAHCVFASLLLSAEHSRYQRPDFTGSSKRSRISWSIHAK